jgi:PAS domain-containing protein
MTTPNLALSLEQLTQLMEGSPLGIYVSRPDDIDDDRTMRLIYANKTSEAHTGVPPSQLVGKYSEEVFPSLRERGFIDMFFRVLRTGAPEHYEDMYYADEKIAAAFAGDVRPLPGGLIAIWFENITKRKQVEQAIVGHGLDLTALEAHRILRDALRECLSELPARSPGRR